MKKVYISGDRTFNLKETLQKLLYFRRELAKPEIKIFCTFPTFWDDC